VVVYGVVDVIGYSEEPRYILPELGLLKNLSEEVGAVIKAVII